MITGTSSYSWTSIKLSSHPWGTGKWALYRGGHKLAKSLAENFKTNLQWEKQYESIISRHLLSRTVFSFITFLI